MMAATWVTAAGTALLAIGAVVTAVFAFLAFRQQASEVETLQQQARDQSKQLELQGLQYAEQHELSSRQSAVLELQAQELASSLAKLEREAARRHRAQADRVHFWDERRHLEPKELAEQMNRATVGFLRLTPNEGEWHILAHVQNNSDLAIWGLRLEWHLGTNPIDTPNEIPELAAGKQVTVERRLDRADGELRLEADLLFRDAAGVTWRRRISGELEEIPAPTDRSR
jgi:hypothetical protein